MQFHGTISNWSSHMPGAEVAEVGPVTAASLAPKKLVRGRKPLSPARSWSGCPDLNRGPLRPERSALPS
jgi:hypothetical protein